MIDRFFGDTFWGFWGTVLQYFLGPVLGYCSAVWCTGPDTHLKLLDHAVLTGGVFECDILLIVDPWQFYVCFITSGVTRSTLLMVLYLDHMSQCGLHAVL